MRLFTNSLLLILGGLNVATKEAAANLGCFTNFIPVPKAPQGCIVNITYADNTWHAASDCVTCPAPTKRPTHPPQKKTRKPTKKATGSPTPEPTPMPTVRVTQKHTPAPHKPTHRPTHRKTPAPTKCMPAEAVDSNLLAVDTASYKDANKNSGRRLKTAANPSENFDLSLVQFGSGYISYLENGLSKRCIAALASPSTMVFPASCMFRNFNDKFGNTLREIPQEWYNTVSFNVGSLSANYRMGFYADDYQASGNPEFNIAAVTLDSAIGKVCGWFNTSDLANDYGNQIRFAPDNDQAAIMDKCCSITTNPDSALVDYNCANTANSNGALLFSQVKNKQGFMYFLRSIGADTGQGVSARIIRALVAYAEGETQPVTNYYGSSVNRSPDRVLTC